MVFLIDFLKGLCVKHGFFLCSCLNMLSALCCCLRCLLLFALFTFFCSYAWYMLSIDEVLVLLWDKELYQRAENMVNLYEEMYVIYLLLRMA